ncbi:MAG: haloacid dehalogenase type II [Gammaproteobacteria bacterium]|nr:haloacid dehalogenase type II [Gammaproteobacteria bacterium]
MNSSLQLNTFKLLSFDCYGTLIDWENGMLRALRDLGGPALEAVADEELLEAFAATESDLEVEFPRTRYSRILVDTYRALARDYALPVADHRADAFAASIAEWPAFADTVAALRHLRQFFKLAVLSNTDHKSFAQTQGKLGVAFDYVFVAEDIGSYKPDRRNFEYMLDALSKDGIQKNDILHVAQSRFHDVEPAGALGLKTVWVNRRHKKPGWGATLPPQNSGEPDLSVKSLAELVELHQWQTEEKFHISA